MSSNKLRVCIAHPADPCGSIPGGIDTFIRGEIDNAPDDVEYKVIGITTDPEKRPVGEWTRCMLRAKSFDFFPVTDFEVTDRRSIVPVIVQYLVRVGSMLDNVETDVIEIHRFETILRIGNKALPVTAVLHQNMQSLYDKQADIRWARLPRTYFWLEDKLAPRLQSAFCVREEATQHYKKRFENLAETCRFQPTWADPRQFSPPTADERSVARARLSSRFDLDGDSRWLLMVGRLDAQKNPMLLLAALKWLKKSGNYDFNLLVVGEGQLRGEMEQAVDQDGLSANVRFLGLKSIDEVSKLLHTADLFVMSSAYEGMPMAVIEALACGVPVATTRVGEVALVVKDRVCGRISESHSEEHLTEAISWCLDNLSEIRGEPCLRSASKYRPAIVLEPVYENYRRLAAGKV